MGAFESRLDTLSLVEASRVAACVSDRLAQPPVLVAAVKGESGFLLGLIVKAESIGIAYRDEPSNVIGFRRSAKREVNGVTLYDRWVGGSPRGVRVKGRLLDRMEEVTTYKLGSQSAELGATPVPTGVPPEVGWGHARRNGRGTLFRIPNALFGLFWS